ncbi:MAG: nucleotide exchange factor GrpE [Clostridia bacterium]|nr:nucleotide exchange factor GrpE [Clostridia bacterium]
MSNEELMQEEQPIVSEACETEAKPKKKCNKKNEELEKALAEAEECKRKWYAVTAEYENYRRRTQNQAAQRYQDGRNDVVASLFPIGDNLERAMAVCADENTKQGLDMILKAFKKVLEGEGVEEIDPVGQPFNADTMEAIMAMPCEEGEESGIVKQAYVKGYKKGDKVLRYAQVIVTQ